MTKPLLPGARSPVGASNRNGYACRCPLRVRPWATSPGARIPTPRTGAPIGRAGPRVGATRRPSGPWSGISDVVQAARRGHDGRGDAGLSATRRRGWAVARRGPGAGRRVPRCGPAAPAVTGSGQRYSRCLTKRRPMVRRVKARSVPRADGRLGQAFRGVSWLLTAGGVAGARRKTPVSSTSAGTSHGSPRGEPAPGEPRRPRTVGDAPRPRPTETCHRTRKRVFRAAEHAKCDLIQVKARPRRVA